MTDTTRDAFEVWFKKDKGHGLIEKSETGGYIWVTTSEAWEAWQAATEQGKRQPLTDEQIDDLAKIHGDYSASHGGNYSMNADGRWSVLTFARAIEAAITATPQGKI